MKLGIQIKVYCHRVDEYRVDVIVNLLLDCNDSYWCTVILVALILTMWFVIVHLRKTNRVPLHTDVAGHFSCEGEEEPCSGMHAVRSTTNGCLEQKWGNNWGYYDYVHIIHLLSWHIIYSIIVPE